MTIFETPGYRRAAQRCKFVVYIARGGYDTPAVDTNQRIRSKILKVIIPTRRITMKRQIVSWISVAGLLALALIFVFVSPTVRGTTPAPGGVVSGQPAQERHDAREDLHHAEDKLREARGLLASAPGEFGGHRDKAIRKIDEALQEVHEAWESH
jgi:hypothetical protein